jgi:S1-C subfamily serine protease
MRLSKPRASRVLRGFTNNLIVSRGNVQTDKIVQSSVVFANGNVTVKGVITSSVIVCDGDVTVVEGNVSSSLVVARGNITIKGGASAATLLAGSKVSTGKQWTLDETHFNIIKENEQHPLRFITFFELSSIGLDVAMAGGVVRVSKVAAGQEAEKARLKVGDVVLDVGGQKPADAEVLRRHLRDALGVGDAIVKLKRGTETLTVKLALPE